MINGMEMSPGIRHASWGTKGENLPVVISMLFLEEVIWRRDADNQNYVLYNNVENDLSSMKC